MNKENIIKTFLTYGFLGWTMENIKNWNDEEFMCCNPIFKYYLSRKICFVPFPFCYGLGGLFILYLHKNYPDLSLLAKIILFIIIFNVIELSGGYFAEKCICNNLDTCPEGNKIWNYKGSGNLGGHIDLEHSVYWIALGLIGYYIYPFIEQISIYKLSIIMFIIWIIISIKRYPKSYKMELSKK